MNDESLSPDITSSVRWHCCSSHHRNVQGTLNEESICQSNYIFTMILMRIPSVKSNSTVLWEAVQLQTVTWDPKMSSLLLSVVILHNDSCIFFFLDWQRTENTSMTHQEPAAYSPTGTYRASLMTSPVEGAQPSLLTQERASRRDKAKALAALQARRTRQRKSQAASALRWTGKGSPRTLAFAKCRKKSRVSSDHRPPTSHASTTRRALPNWPDSSG